MKMNKLIKYFSTIFLTFLFIFSCGLTSVNAAIDFTNIQGTGTNPSGTGVSTNKGYSVPSTTHQDIVAFRISIVDKNGNLKLKSDGKNSRTVDVYLSKSTYGTSVYNGTRAAYVFNSVKNKFQCKSLLDSGKKWTMGAYPKMGSNAGDFTPSTNTVAITNATYKANNVFLDSNLESPFTSWSTSASISDITGKVQSWLSANNFSVLKEFQNKNGVSINSFDNGDYVIAEPMFLVSLDNVEYAMTISEIGLFSTLLYGNSTPPSSSTDGAYSFISKKLHQEFPMFVRAAKAVASVTVDTTPPEYVVSNGVVVKNTRATGPELVNHTYGLIAIQINEENNPAPKTYTVTYNANGGTGTMANSTATYNKNFVTRQNSFIRTGYTFNGWNEKADGTGTPWLLTSSGVYENGNGTKPWKWTYTKNITLYAQWTPTPYKITYNPNGGTYAGSTSNSTTSYNITSNITIAGTPTRTGYTFNGWKVTTAGGNWSSTAQYNAGQNIGKGKYGNVTLTAQWSKTLTLSFNANGGSGAPSSISHTIYNAATTSKFDIPTTKPTKSGYTFVGWGTSTTDTSKDYSAGGSITLSGNYTLYAIWSKDITLSFNANGGSGAPSSITHTIYNAATTSKFNIPTTKPTRNGYTFLGWSTSSSATSSSYSAGGSITLKGDDILYAVWSQDTYTITYKWSDGTTIAGLSPSTYTYSESNTTVASVPSVTGYTTKGWYTNSSCTDNTSTGPYTSIAAKATGNITLYAKKTANTYTITFNGNGATSGSMSNIQMKYDMVNSSPITNQFKRTGYKFAGWSISGMTSDVTHYRGQSSSVNTSFTGTTYSGPSNSTYFKNLRSTSGTVTLTAQWAQDTYTITYKWNDGTTITGLSPSTYTYSESNTTVASVPTVKGYTTTGWYTNSACTSGPYKSIAAKTTGNVTLYAKKTINTYTITYKWSDGTTIAGLSPSTYTYSESNTTVASVPSVTGYTTKGWYTNSSCADNTSTGPYKSIAAKTTGNVTLYAKKTINTYTITYKWSDGTTIAGLSPATYTISSSNTKLATVPSVTGYATKGWYQTSACSGSTVSSIATNVTGDKIFYATKTAYKLTINYYANGGVLEGESSTKTSVLLTQKFDYGSTAFSSSGVYNYTGTGGTLSMKKPGYTGTGNWLVDNTSSSAKTINQNTTYEKSQDLATAAGKNLANGNVTITLYAQWAPITYQIKYNGNGSTSGSMSNSTHTYDIAKNLTANAFKREFTVTYVYNSSAENTTKKASATFNGWAKTATGNKSYNNQQSVKNLTSTQGAVVNLYAKWTDGSVTHPTPTKTGYTFDGWYTASAGGTRVGGGGNSYTPTENTTLYAQWTPITYEVKYNGNGSTSGSMSNSTHTYDIAKNLTANAFKREFTVTYVYNSSAENTTKKASATFNGWAKTATGNKSYNNQQSVKNLTSTQDAVVNLYAKWTDGSVTHPTPTKTGYTFTGWYTSSTGGTKVGEGGNSYMPTENTTLYAQWTPNTYNVYLYPNGGTKTTDVSFIPADNNVVHWKWEANNNRWVASFEYDSDKYVSIPANNTAFTCVGYHQDGWKKDNTTTFSEQTYNGSSDLHLYAQWKENPDDVAGDENTTYIVEHYKYLDDSNTWELIETEIKRANINDEITEYPVPPFGYRCSEAETSITLPNWSGSELYKAPKSISVRVTQNSSTKIIFRYILDVCKITYNLNGGTYNNSESDYKITVDRLSTITLITPTKDGYTFAGWYLYVDENGGQGYQGTAGDEYIAYEDVTFYALWTRDDNFVDLQIVTNKLYGNIVPNKPFVASATILNLSDTDVIPSNPASVKLTISYLDENGNFKEVGNRTASVIVPARNKNLVFVDVDGINAPIGSELRFEWNLYYSNSTLVDYIQDNNYDSNIIADENENITKTKQSIKVTPYDFKSTTPTPEFTLTPNEEYTPTPASTSINTYSWDVWEYKNGKFEIVSYNSKLPEDTTIAEITLTPENNEGLKEIIGNDYVTRSGYGFSADIKYTVNKDVEFGEMRAALLVPEYSYKLSNSMFEDLNTRETYNSDGTKTYSMSLYPSDKETTTGIHYTPMWYPNGEYITTLSIGGMWTPIGELQAEICHGSMSQQEQNKYRVKTNKITIDGSLYDDMYIVNDRFDDEDE